MGVLAALLSAFLSSSKDIVSKRLSFSVSSTVSTFASFYYALPFYILLLAVLWWSGLETFEFSVGFIGLVVLRSLTDVGAEWLKMHAFSKGDLSLVSLFLSMSPLFLLIFSPMITGDEISRGGIIAMIAIVLGSSAIIYRPVESRAQAPAIFFAVASAMFFALNSCFDRLAVQTASPTLSGFAMTALSAAFLLPFLFRESTSASQLSSNRNNFLIRGLFEVAFMVTKLYALTFLPAPYVAGIQRISLLVSIMGGHYVFKEGDFLRRLVAGILVLAGVIFMILTS